MKFIDTQKPHPFTDLTQEQKSLDQRGFWICSFFNNLKETKHHRLAIAPNLLNLLAHIQGSGKGPMWFPGIFTKKTSAKQKHFFKAYLLVLDIDGETPARDFISIFGHYKMLILASQSHRKENKDSYRVIIQMSEAVDNLSSWIATLRSAKEIFENYVDDKCFDASRRFYFCNKAFEPLYTNLEGRAFQIEPPQKEDVQKAELIVNNIEHNQIKGFNRADTIFHSISFFKTDKFYHTRSFKHFKQIDPTDTKLIRHDQVLTVQKNGNANFVWWPAADPSFSFQKQEITVKNRSIWINKKVGIKSLKRRFRAAYFIDIIDAYENKRKQEPTGKTMPKDLVWLKSAILTEHPKGQRLWFYLEGSETHQDETLFTLIGLLEKIGIFDRYDVSNDSLCWTASTTVVPFELNEIKKYWDFSFLGTEGLNQDDNERKFPLTKDTLDRFQRSQSFKNALRAYKIRMKRKRTEEDFQKSKIIDIKTRKPKVSEKEVAPSTNLTTNDLSVRNPKTEKTINSQIVIRDLNAQKNKQKKSACDAKRIVANAYKGKLPDELPALFRSPYAERILRLFLGYSKFKESIYRRLFIEDCSYDKEYCFSLNTVLNANALEIETHQKIHPHTVGRFIAAMLKHGLIAEVDRSYKIGRKGKQYLACYKLTQMLKPIMKQLIVNMKSKNKITLKDFPPPKAGSFNKWVMAATATASSQEEFISELMLHHGDFISQKKDRLLEAKKAFKAHQKRKNRFDLSHEDS